MVTPKPSLTNRLATSAPIPPDAPVMMALFLTEFVIGGSPFPDPQFCFQRGWQVEPPPQSLPGANQELLLQPANLSTQTPPPSLQLIGQRAQNRIACLLRERMLPIPSQLEAKGGSWFQGNRLS